MPIGYARRLTSRTRSDAANRHLGLALAFIAGAINAGGFLAVQQYTSHMTGIVSAMADNIALGGHSLVWGGLGAVLTFILGAACSTVMITYARRQRLHSEYALPLLLEALLLLCFGFLGATLAQITGLFVPLTVMLLCFIMGLQNALITNLTKAEIRTTHITGIITDIGIEIGKLVYINRSHDAAIGRVTLDRQRMLLLSLLAVYFFCGGIVGALGFNYLGYIATVPLALFLVLLASVPVFDDLLVLLRR